MWVNGRGREIAAARCPIPAAILVALVFLPQYLLSQASSLLVRTTVRDSAANRPLVGAIVRVVSNDQTFITDSMGTTSVRLPAAGGSLIASAIGFTPETLSVVSQADVTIQMRRLQVLGEQEVVAAKETGSERKLRQFGFLDRKKTSGAPQSAFVTEAELEKWRPSLVTDISVRIGRDLRRCTVYVDGARAAVPAPMRGASQPYRWGVDALVVPSEITAMEVYRIAEAPIEYPVRGRDECSLLIWLK